MPTDSSSQRLAHLYCTFTSRLWLSRARSRIHPGKVTCLSQRSHSVSPAFCIYPTLWGPLFTHRPNHNYGFDKLGFDRLFSMMRSGEESLYWPGSIRLVWRLSCLIALLVEDVEDAYTLGFLVMGSLLTGLGRYHKQVLQAKGKNLGSGSPPAGLDGLGRSVQTPNQCLLDLSWMLAGEEDQNII